MERGYPGANVIISINTGTSCDTGYPIINWVKDVTGKLIASATAAAMTEGATGVYSYTLAIPAYTQPGPGNCQINVVKSGVSKIKYVAFEVV